jgi:hypothetical protein
LKIHIPSGNTAPKAIFYKIDLARWRQRLLKWSWYGNYIWGASDWWRHLNRNSLDSMLLLTKVARFFMSQYTKTVENIPNWNLIAKCP